MTQIAREIVRKYGDEVVARINGLSGVPTESLASVNGHPLFACVARLETLESKPWVLISGGVHGDEIAGVYAAIRFLASRATAWTDRYQFAVLPCVNPTGFELNTLEAADGTNLNRVWGINSSQPEVAAIERWLKRFKQKFLVTFDLHEVAPDYRGEGFVESDNPRGCYLYETVTDQSPRIGRAMIDALPPGTEVCRWPLIYNDRNDNGVVDYPQACGNEVYKQGTTLDGYLNGRFTTRSFTLETPMGWPLEKRVQTHLLWLETALKQLASG